MGELYEPFPKLPKNIRQIGERDQVLKLYLEDYVNTYLKRLQPAKGADLRVGLLLGSRESHEDTPYVFVDGALEMDSVTEAGEKVVFTEDAWKKAYQDVEQMFPKRTVQGWFLCGGPDCSLSPLNYWRQHSQYFTGKNQLMYLNCGLEGEEAVYITSSDGFYKLRGYSVYYERNQMMQDYMILRKDVPRAESEVDDKVIRNYKQRMDERRNEAGRHKSTVGVLSGLCSALAVTVLAGGVAMFNNYQKMHQMESVIASVMPDGSVKQGLLASSGRGLTENPSGKDWSAPDEPDYIIEEAAGKVYPTTAPADENGREQPDKLTRETMPAAESSARDDGGTQAADESGSAGAGSGASGSGEASGNGSGASGSGEASGNGSGASGSGKASGNGSAASGSGGASGNGSGASSSGQSSGNGSGASGSGEASGNGSASSGSGEASGNGNAASSSGQEKAAQAAKGAGETSTRKETVPPATGAREDGAAETVSAVNYSVYTVGEGETLYGICFKLYHNLKHIDEICRVNALADENSIIAGQKLLVP